MHEHCRIIGSISNNSHSKGFAGACFRLCLFDFSLCGIEARHPATDIGCRHYVSGRGPEEVEGEVTTRFEEAISGVSNMLWTQSFSTYGQSFVIVFYKPGTNLDLAASEVQRNIDRVTDLPSTIQQPQILKASDRVTLPIYQFALTGDMDLVTASTWADKDIVPRILRLPGVGDCQDDGNLTRQMTITYDPQRLKARGLTANDVKRFVDRANFNQSGGYFVQGHPRMDNSNSRGTSQRGGIPKINHF